MKRGVGMAQSHWSANVQTNSACEVRILRDGSVDLLSSVQDIGTGITTVLAQVVAEELGLRAEDVTIRIGDTEFPSGPPSYGSLTTASITPPARNAAHRVLQQLLAAVAPELEAPRRRTARARRPHRHRRRVPRHELQGGRGAVCAATRSARSRRGRTTTAASPARWVTWPMRAAISVASSSPP